MPAAVDLLTVAGKLFPLFFLVVVHDFEFRIDNIAFAFAGAFLGATARLRLGARACSWRWTCLR